MGIEKDRLKLERISASEGTQYAELINDFTRKIAELGPSHIKGSIKVIV